MDTPGKAPRFRERGTEIRTSNRTMKEEESRKELMRLVDYYEQMAISYENLAKSKTRN